MHQNNNIMKTPDTRIFRVEVLKFKPYGLLMKSLNTFIEVASDLEEYLEEFENNPSENVDDINIVTTQLDCLYQNIKNTIDAMKYIEDKSFFKVNELPLVCLN